MSSKMTQVLKDQVAEVLRHEIYLGNIKDGESLTQAIISDKLGVSRMPVREAFLQLEAEGVLLRLQNRHVKVIGMTEKRVRQIFSAISAIEISMAQQLDRVDSIQQAFDKYKASIPLQGQDKCTKLLLGYHMSISEALDNPYLNQLHKRMLDGYPRFLLKNCDINWKIILEYQQVIMSAIFSGSVEEISSSIETFYDYLFEYAVKEYKLE